MLFITSQLGKTKADMETGIYRTNSRVKEYSLADLMYIDGRQVTPDLSPEDIYLLDGITLAVSKQDIAMGKIVTTPTMPITPARLLEDILYAYQYFNSSYKEVYFNDSLSLSDYPLIPIRITDTTLEGQIYSLIREYYPDATDDEIDTIQVALLNYNLPKKLSSFLKNELVFTVDSTKEYFDLIQLGHPYAIRYEYGLLDNKRTDDSRIDDVSTDVCSEKVSNYYKHFTDNRKDTDEYYRFRPYF